MVDVLVVDEAPHPRVSSAPARQRPEAGGGAAAAFPAAAALPRVLAAGVTLAAGGALTALAGLA
jgi:hypothetical protein